jgi:hypothetical protein
MDRIPLRAGLSTPDFVERVLSVFGNNPHGEPNFRLIWSERKQIYFMGEIVPEYLYLDPQAWVLETWVSPEKDAGPEAAWGAIQQATMGEYPRFGTYNIVKSYPSDWYPSEDSVRLVAKGIVESRNIEMKARMKAIREGLQSKAKVEREKVADAIVELQDSASLGKIQQSASGPKNTFRTPDDFGRDQEKVQKEYAHLPKRGGKILKETE